MILIFFYLIDEKCLNTKSKLSLLQHYFYLKTKKKKSDMKCKISYNLNPYLMKSFYLSFFFIFLNIFYFL